MEKPTVRTHVLRAPVAMRPLAISAALIVVGAGLLVLSVANAWWVGLIVAAVLILLAGLAVGALAVLLPRRMAVRVSTTAGGYRIASGTVVREGRWVDVVRATQAGSGIRVTLERRDGTEHHMFSPVGGRDPRMLALTRDVASRLKNRYDAGIDSG